MCLIVKPNQRIQTAKSDIICYKFVDDLYNNGELTTSFQNVSIIIGNTYKSEIVRHFDEIYIALHSYVNLEKATAQIYRYEDTAHVVECTIPKGSRYIKGHFDTKFGKLCYASDTITYNTILKSH